MKITQTYLNQLGPQLTERDLAIVETIGRFKLLTGGQLERLYFADCSDRSRARNRQAVLKRLVDHQVLARVGERARGGSGGGSKDYVYTLDIAGQHVAGLTSSRPRRPYVWYEPNVGHYLAVAELYVELVEAGRAGELTLLTFETEPYCWRAFEGRTLKPDAFVQVGLEREGRRRKGSFFIEVDRADQWGTKISTKFPQYIAFREHERRSGRVFPLVLFLAPTQRRIDYLNGLVQAQSEPIFRVAALSAAMAAVTTGV
jgi:hypothetical protein